MDKTVKHVLFYVGLKPAGNLMLAEMEDGTYCILRDDKPLDDLRWKGKDLGKAVTRFHEIKSELAPAP